jgi:hypothetical protein
VIGGVFEVLQRRIREAGGCAASVSFWASIPCGTE